MNRDKLEPRRYEYLSQAMSDLYDRADSMSREEAIQILKLLIEEEARKNRQLHNASSR